MRNFSLGKYLSVFLITFLLFLAVFLLAQRISSETSQDLVKHQKQISNYLLSLNLQTEIAKENICNVDILKLTEDKARLGKELDVIEKNLGSDNDDVKNMKLDYTLLSIRQWLLIKQFKKECNSKLNIILFFYSNKISKDKSEAQGYVLDYIYRKYSDKVLIYAFDSDIDTPALNAIKNIYNISSTPSLVINERVFEGLLNSEQIEKEIGFT
jgi:hypothetical protein